MNSQHCPYHRSGTSAERGFSLVELLVVLALIGLMGSFVASAYLFSERAVLQWKRNMRLQNELHTLLNGIAEDIYRAEVLENIDNHRITLIMPDDSSRIYEMSGHSLIRNENKLNNESIEVVRLEFETNVDQGRQGIRFNDITLIGIKLSITDRRDTLELNRAVHLRRPLTWKLLREE